MAMTYDDYFEIYEVHAPYGGEFRIPVGEISADALKLAIICTAVTVRRDHETQEFVFTITDLAGDPV